MVSSELLDHPEVVLYGRRLVLEVQLLVGTHSELLQGLDEGAVLAAHPGPHGVAHLVGRDVGVHPHAAGRQLPQHQLVRHPGLAAARVSPVQPEHVGHAARQVAQLRVGASRRQLVQQLVEDHAAFAEAHQRQREARRDAVGPALGLQGARQAGPLHAVSQQRPEGGGRGDGVRLPMKT